MAKDGRVSRRETFMPDNFRIENLDALARMRDSLKTLRDGGAQVISRAIGTLRRRLPVAARKDIGAQYALPADKVRPRLLCTGDATSVTLTGLGRPQALSNFPARQNASGVAVQIEKGKSLQIQHAFIRNTPGGSGGEQVLIRDAALSLADLPDQVIDIAVVDHSRHGYPIVLLGGPSVADMLRDGDREERLADLAQDVFGKEVDRLAEIARGQ
jgi:hypothetical protein